ncbi:hypothetical protein NHL50_16925 [Acidimicrobiia bacterium EGI L10123]|uniref:protein-tyrosine phosphatase family protein n=1 Tax=Salinilacustrithrix flava TaxID=2957203 RepID=UPI003D7C26D8|nr:hypothetical protein [Acidimicrobiia bacterium EGI L10123]
MGRVTAWRSSERSRNGGIDRVPVPGAPGALWLCGKHLIGPDVEATVARVDAHVVLCLNERHELEARYPDYVAWLRTDPRAWWAPVPDLHAPPLDDAIALVEGLVEHLDAGRTVLTHCGAGIGRAGTIAAAVLITRGTTVDEAVAQVAASRPGAGPEAGAQEELLQAIAGAQRNAR